MPCGRDLQPGAAIAGIPCRPVQAPSHHSALSHCVPHDTTVAIPSGDHRGGPGDHLFPLWQHHLLRHHPVRAAAVRPGLKLAECLQATAGARLLALLRCLNSQGGTYRLPTHLLTPSHVLGTWVQGLEDGGEPQLRFHRLRHRGVVRAGGCRLGEGTIAAAGQQDAGCMVLDAGSCGFACCARWLLVAACAQVYAVLSLLSSCPPRPTSR